MKKTKMDPRTKFIFSEPRSRPNTMAKFFGLRTGEVLAEQLAPFIKSILGGHADPDASADLIRDIVQKNSSAAFEHFCTDEKKAAEALYTRERRGVFDPVRDIVYRPKNADVLIMILVLDSGAATFDALCPKQLLRYSGNVGKMTGWVLKLAEMVPDIVIVYDETASKFLQALIRNVKAVSLQQLGKLAKKKGAHLCRKYDSKSSSIDWHNALVNAFGGGFGNVENVIKLCF